MRVVLLGFWLILALSAESGPERMHREMLEAHNRVRAAVGVRPLVWSDKLADAAQTWANQLLAERRLRHRANPRYGENLYLISRASATPNDVVSAWASEERDYEYASNSCHSRCGHYTQIVWRSTRQVGCARARSPVLEVWVCEYYPPGNYIGQRPY